MKKALIIIGVSIVSITIVLFSLFWIYIHPFMKAMKVMEVSTIDSTLTIFAGGGGNSGILSSDSLVVVIDTKVDQKSADSLYKLTKVIAGKKKILVINTHIHTDHVFGNKLFAGSDIWAGGNYTAEQWTKENGKEGVPNVWIKTKRDIPMGLDTLTVFNLGENVHTASDVMVYSHRRKMLFTGDVVLNHTNPVLMGVADPLAYIKTFDKLENTLIINAVIPGHGPIGGIEIINDFRTYFEDMKSAALDPSKKDAMKKKYNDWRGIPGAMSPGATIRKFEKILKKA